MNLQTDWMFNRFRLTPDQTAVIDGDNGNRWTYKQMDQRSRGLSQYLMDRGIVKGDRIAILSPNDVSYMDMIFACMRVGAILVPLNWRLSAAELAYIVDDCTPKLLAYHSRLEPVVSALSVAERIQVDGDEYALLEQEPWQRR